jgi:hypothetical protein
LSLDTENENHYYGSYIYACAPSPCFRLVKAPYQFKHLINLRSISFGLRPLADSALDAAATLRISRRRTQPGGKCEQVIYRLEFISNLMRSFICSIIILHLDPQHVSSIAVLIFRKTILYLQYLGSSHSVCCHTECDDSRYCKYTIVLLKMSTAILETC